MKKISGISAAIILLIVAGCNGGEQSSGDFLTVNVTKKYSSKKELILQDFMDVEYVKLETSDQLVNQGFVRDIGEKIILITNYVDDGDIFVYHRSGKNIRKINRQGKAMKNMCLFLELSLMKNMKKCLSMTVLQEGYWYMIWKNDSNEISGIKKTPHTEYTISIRRT